MFTINYQIDDSIEIFGKVYKVDLSFDNVLRFFDMLQDEDIHNVDKILLGINILLGVSFLCSLEESYAIFNQLKSDFLKNEEVVKRDRQGNLLPTKKIKQNYSFTYDAAYIYASFMQAYGIDLLKEQGSLHWTKFKALLEGLPENTKFRQVIDIRTREMPKGKYAQRERKALRELKRLYALPGSDDEEEGEGED